ncbi:transferase [Hyphomicrobium denitrificans 1NES1]|uniref:Transferase n=1 Tax=Hyphomicrobium denitrificans 1NES1 TaxID=670307 RepID=N0B495_9HYPH|nr:gamma carbonic anhydrase family protein [Hyphomicrobium denitrificans]AGK57833.1 transferase [Hyphomicrobium denitrificans 1NES1]
MTLYNLDGVDVATPASGAFWVASNAVLLGKVKLEEDASVWFGAVLRGDNEWITVGERSNVQDGCVLHTDPGFPLTIGTDCTIGHMVMLHGCTIGRGSLIGIGSIILNGARIGEECVIGANTLIPENKEIPSRSMVVGSPGKIIRQIDDEDAARFQGAAARYVANWKRFAAGLKPQKS